PKFQISLLNLTLLLTIPFTPQTLTKTPTTITTSQPKITSNNTIIINLTTKKIIYTNQPNLIHPITSITKIITTIIILNTHL
ncbi:D-alanyl-D-alanine endopeptidase, partial [Bacillus thuringiensis]|nr:D-alanyl-D-alanine endopeptidase [Bacillus thuringiensis]